MKAMDKAFTRVDETFEAIRDSLNQQAINNIARKLAQDLRRAQQARIRSQKAPDGTEWTPRRRRVTRIQERIRFIWNNEARTLKNWHHDTGKYGRTITGWDEDKNNIRTFYRDDIDRFLEIRTRRINQDSTKRVPMFVERDQVAPGIFTDYPVRELLGISQADERLIYNTVLGRIAEAVR